MLCVMGMCILYIITDYSTVIFLFSSRKETLYSEESKDKLTSFYIYHSINIGKYPVILSLKFSKYDAVFKFLHMYVNRLHHV